MSPAPSPASRLTAVALVLLAFTAVGLRAQDLPTPRRPSDGNAPPIPAASSSSQSLADDVARAIASRPVTVPFQRTVADALALSKASGKPLLICVNMDGETASDSLASGAYRDADFGALAAGFVPVIASPDRHAPDRDGRGRRVECPRFGGVTCGEHIATEPDVFERFFAGTRVAPRHVGVSPAGEVIFDLYLLHDLSVIDRTLAEHGRPEQQLPALGARFDASWLASPDRNARAAVERAYLDGDTSFRLGLVQLALDPTRPVNQRGVLALALRDASADVRHAAAERVAAMVSLADVDLCVEAAREAWPDAPSIDALATGLAAAGQGAAGDARARRLSVMLPAALTPVAGLEIGRWAAALALAELHPWEGVDTDALYDEVGRLGEAIAAEPERAELRRDLAATLLDLADGYLEEGQSDVSWLWQEAHEAARQAVERAADDGLAWSLLARADWLMDGTDVAADAAAKALPRLLDLAGSVRVVDTLDVLVGARSEQVRLALDAGEAIDPLAVSQVVAAARLLALHPLAADWQLAVALDVLGGWELEALHAELTLAGVTRFPESPDLHDHLRWHLLRDGDAADVPAAYARLPALAASAEQASGRWFAAYAALAAGDLLRSERRMDAARQVYDLALAGFDVDAVGDLPFRALTLAGLGRVQLAQGDALAAAGLLQQALTESPESMSLPASDGETPATTARSVVRALYAAREQERAQALSKAIAQLD